MQEEQRPFMLSKLAGIGALFISPPNAALAAIFFIIAIGSLDYYFPDLGNYLLYGMAIMLGIGFVIGESIAYILQARDGGLLGAGIGTALVIFLCAYVNIGAGNYRAKDYERESANTAKINVQNDPRWQSLQADRDAQIGLLSNGTYRDDATANARLLEIQKEEKDISNEYVANSHINKMKSSTSGIESLIDYVFANRQVFTFALVAINIIFGLCIHTWYKYRDGDYYSPTEKKEGIFKKAGQVAHRKLDNALARGSISPEINRPITAHQEKPQWGFHGSQQNPEKKTPASGGSLRPVPVGPYPEFSEAAERAERGQKSRQIRNGLDVDHETAKNFRKHASPYRGAEDVAKELNRNPNASKKELKELAPDVPRYGIKAQQEAAQERDMKELGSRGLNTRLENKAKKKQALRQFLGRYPNASKKQMREYIGVSPNTLDTYLDEMA
jgi:hypothetical protein